MIDLMGSVIPNDAEIEAAMQAIINSTWPPSKREKVLRTGSLKAELDAFFAEMSAAKAAIIADRDLLISVIEYEQAEQRLAQPVVAPILDDNSVVTNQQQIDDDVLIRAQDEFIISHASVATVALAVKRKPQPIEQSTGI